ncbi:MAG: hypothetical protein ACRCZW_02130 [Lactobacillaceae bacterium]
MILIIHYVQLVVANKFLETRVDITIKTDVRMKYNKPDITVVDKKLKDIVFIGMGVTPIGNPQQVKTEKLRKYDLLANELGLIHGCKTKIISYVLTHDNIIIKYHTKYRNELETYD